MILRKELPSLELSSMPPAVLTSVAVSTEQKSVRDLTAEASWNVDVGYEPDNSWKGKLDMRRSELALLVHFENLGFPVKDQPNSATSRDDS